MGAGTGDFSATYEVLVFLPSVGIRLPDHETGYLILRV